MSVLKSEIKMSTLAEFASKLDNLYVNADKEYAQCEGAKMALLEASKKIEQHFGFIDKDMDEGKIDAEQAKMIKKYMMQVIGIVNNLATGAEVRIHQANGKRLSLDATVKLAKNMFDTEQARLNALKSIENEEAILGDTVSPRDRIPGQHPGDPMADRRKKDENPVSEELISQSEIKTDK